MLNIVLVEPRIPQNCGNIGRVCVALDAMLHLIHPLGFRIEEKALKRAGMDYWELLKLKEWDSLDSFFEHNPIDSNHLLFSTKAQKFHYDATYKEDSFLLFGREDKGLDEELIFNHISNCYKIPMSKSARSLNLAVAVGVVGYEAYRQINKE